MGEGYRFLLLAVIIATNGFFAAAEVALLSTRKSKLRQMAEGGNVGAQAALSLLANPERLLSVVQVGVTLASLGLGLLISVIADSERQAVQLALLLLLASVFFSGFVLPINEFREGVQYGAYALPVTHGIRLLQDLMLRGDTTAWWQMTALAGIGIVLLILTTLALRRSMRNA